MTRLVALVTTSNSVAADVRRAAMLDWQTQAFLERETARDAYAVHLRPEIVGEVAFDELQASPRYPGGLALYAAQRRHQQPEPQHA